MKWCLLVVASAFVSFSSVARAEIIFAFRQQAGTIIENTGNERAVYLGRFEFDGLPPATDILGIWAGVTVRDANNVRLYLGNGNVQFQGNSSLVDTGIVFNQLTANQPTAVAAPGLPPSELGPGVAPLALSAIAGQSLRQMLADSVSTSFPSGYLDGWLVSDDPSHLFTAPSSSDPLSGSSTPFNAFVGLTAVPEPASLALVGMIILGIAVRRFKSVGIEPELNLD
jgi:hypothetical protein